MLNILNFMGDCSIGLFVVLGVLFLMWVFMADEERQPYVWWFRGPVFCGIFLFVIYGLGSTFHTVVKISANVSAH
jgi:hypothetical protein